MRLLSNSPIVGKQDSKVDVFGRAKRPEVERSLILIQFCLPLGLRRFPMNGNAQISVIGFLFLVFNFVTSLQIVFEDP